MKFLNGSSKNSMEEKKQNSRGMMLLKDLAAWQRSLIRKSKN